MFRYRFIDKETGEIVAEKRHYVVKDINKKGLMKLDVFKKDKRGEIFLFQKGVSYNYVLTSFISLLKDDKIEFGKPEFK